MTVRYAGHHQSHRNFSLRTCIGRRQVSAQQAKPAHPPYRKVSSAAVGTNLSEVAFSSKAELTYGTMILTCF